MYSTQIISQEDIMADISRSFTTLQLEGQVKHIALWDTVLQGNKPKEAVRYSDFTTGKPVAWNPQT